MAAGHGAAYGPGAAARRPPRGDKGDSIPKSAIDPDRNLPPRRGALAERRLRLYCVKFRCLAARPRGG